MKRRLPFLSTALLLAGVVVLSAHVGSSNVFFAGSAGPYDVNIVIRPPQVIPGLAEITVRLPAEQGGHVSRVTVRPVFWQTGSAGSPPAEDATRISAPEPTFTGKLWLMRAGSYSVYIGVDGDLGVGSVTIPVAALPTGQLPLGPGLKTVLGLLGALLALGFIQIVYAAAGESLVGPGEVVSRKRRRTARIAAVIAVPVTALGLFGGYTWWNAEASAYARTLDRPLAVHAGVRVEDGARVLRLEIIEPGWLSGRLSRILPDHGKLMHMFLVREPALDVFAHVHPVMRDSATFELTIPPVPPGSYRLYGDVVHETGLERTVVATVTIPAAPGAKSAAHGSDALPPVDPDDAWRIAQAPVPRLESDTAVPVGNGNVIRWTGGEQPLVAGGEITLRFELQDSTGKALPLEPYMGMIGHAAVSSTNGLIFGHIHPIGTVSMAAQTAFALRERGDTTVDGRLRMSDAQPMSHGAMDMGPAPTSVGFPYGFQTAGKYRIWVQVKHAGHVSTAAFDTEVLPAPPAED